MTDRVLRKKTANPASWNAMRDAERRVTIGTFDLIEQLQKKWDWATRSLGAAAAADLLSQLRIFATLPGVPTDRLRDAQPGECLRALVEYARGEADSSNGDDWRSHYLLRGGWMRRQIAIGIWRAIPVGNDDVLAVRIRRQDGPWTDFDDNAKRRRWERDLTGTLLVFPNAPDSN